MQWSKVDIPGGYIPCASEGCDEVAEWYGEAGGVGSYYCDGCRAKIEPHAKPPLQDDKAE